MIRITDQYFWNFIFGLFFILMVVMGLIILDTEATRPVSELTLTDFVLLALAAHRFTRLFVYDAITKFFREQFYDAKVARGGQVTLYKPESGPRRTMADLLSCPWCFGLWASATVTFFYLLTPFAYLPILILALASVASTLQLLTNLIGHKAEQAKRNNENGG